MSKELYYEDHGCGEGFTISLEDGDLTITCELEGGFSADSMNLSAVIRNVPEVAATIQEIITADNKQEILLDTILPSLQDDESARLFNKVSNVLYRTYKEPVGASLCAVITYVIKEMKEGV